VVQSNRSYDIKNSNFFELSLKTTVVSGDAPVSAAPLLLALLGRYDSRGLLFLSVGVAVFRARPLA